MNFPPVQKGLLFSQAWLASKGNSDAQAVFSAGNAFRCSRIYFRLAFPSAIAQQMPDRQQGAAPASAAAPSIIVAEGELKATVFAYRDGNLVARYKYFWWRDGCYLTYETIGFAPAPPAACQ